ncbi:MAG: transglycosylase SLT domain-containing protein [Patescibacteria group bacterium]|nr:transglycosylase SLT domain-containing protein [Patescibacteria group bacterium]
MAAVTVGAQAAPGSCLTSGQSVTISSADALKLQGQSQVSCADLCSDEKVTIKTNIGFLNITTGATVTETVTRQCKTEDDRKKYGCGKDQIRPRVVIVMQKGEDIRSVTLSKCDKASLLTALKTSIDEETPDALQTLASSQRAELNYAPPSSSAGSQALINALTKDFGISEEDARMIAGNTQSAADLIKAFESGNPAAVGKVVKEVASRNGVPLNTEVLDKIASLDPEQVAKKAAELVDEGIARIGGAATGFRQPYSGDDRALPGGRYGQTFMNAVSQYPDLYAKAPDILARQAKVESGGNPNVCSSSGACGLFQFIPGTWRTWSARWNYAANGNSTPLPDNARFDPNLSSQVTAYYNAYNLRQYGGLIEQSGMDTTAALYAIHNLGDGGGPKFIAAYAQNPNIPVWRVVSPGAIRGNPGLYGDGNISLAQAQQNMLALMGGPTNFTGRERSASPYASNTGYQAPTFSPYTIGIPGNQFGNQSSSYSLAQPPPAPPQPQQVQQSQQAPIQSQSQGGVQGTGAPALGTYPPATRVSVPAGRSEQLMQSVNGVQTPFTGTASGATTPTDPAANIIAQPPRVSAGNPVQVSWSSVGMSESIPCRVLVNDTFLLAEGNQGSRSATSTRSDAGATWKFTLRCTAQGGEEIIKTSSVEIR